MNTLIEWVGVLPLLIIFGAAVVATLLEAFVPRQARRGVQTVFALIAVAAALVVVVWRWTETQAIESPAITPLSITETDGGYTGVTLVEDVISLVAQLVILVAALLSFLIIADRTETGEGAFVASAATRPGSDEERVATKAGRQQTEIFPLALFATGGMMAFTSAFDLLTLFIALEALSLPLYVLSATARRRRLLSQEAALKYFLLGAFSSAFFLMGAAFLYGATGTIYFNEILTVMASGAGIKMIYIVGIVLLVVGMLFKVGAVPFHSWTPDVYQGAPTPITGFMAAGTKAAAFAALARMMMWLVAPVYENINIFMWIVIIATVVLGTVMGLIQKDIKRLLAYSAIAHAGFILIAVNAIDPVETSGDLGQAIGAVLFYTLTYAVATVGAFAIVTLVRESDAEGNILGEATQLSAWRGLGKRKPLLAGAMTLFLLSFAGIPLTAGFIGKFEAFRAGIYSGQTVLVVIAVLASAATAFFYFRIIQLMFFEEPEGESTVVVSSEGMTLVAIALAVVAVIALGIFPDPIYQFILGPLT
ncbi:MAG: NADH-quinone oxidoreductase subunit NuoN [Trueperella sp.]|nr:NADH-quinone oxidoreductase subunit NuoN [Trueperella sp.]